MRMTLAIGVNWFCVFTALQKHRFKNAQLKLFLIGKISAEFTQIYF